MKTLKNLCGKAMIVGLGITAATSYASDWDFSYTFSDGLVVSGSFEGTLNGSVVDGISDVSVFFTPQGGSTTEMAGPITVDSFNGSAWLTTGAVASPNAGLNDFLFMNSSGSEQFYLLPTSIYGAPYAGADFASLGISGLINYPANAASWTLVDPPSAPDGGSTVMLCGISLAALGWIRRKLA